MKCKNCMNVEACMNKTHSVKHVERICKRFKDREEQLHKQTADRNKLIDLIQNAVGGCARHWAEIIADYLLANGVEIKEDPDGNQ